MPDRRFTFFESYKDVAALMTDEERLAFYDAIIGYAICGDEPDGLEGSPLVAFTMARPSLDKSARRSRTNSENARRRKASESESGGKANESKPVATRSETERTGSEAERTETSEQGSLDFALPDIDIDKDVDKDKDRDTDTGAGGGARRTSRPRRPSWDEWWKRWQEVSEERGVPPDKYAAESGYAYYEANGWKQNNGNPISRWRGALMTCFLRAHPELKKQGAKAKDDVFNRYD